MLSKRVVEWSKPSAVGCEPSRLVGFRGGRDRLGVTSLRGDLRLQLGLLGAPDGGRLLALRLDVLDGLVGVALGLVDTALELLRDAPFIAAVWRSTMTVAT